MGRSSGGLIANRLTSPSPLVYVQQWARAWAVGEAFGMMPICSTMIGSAGRWMRSRRISIGWPGRLG